MSLLSIDFSKAFNMVDHRACVYALAECGASTDSIRMIGAFLRGRVMQVKVNSELSEERCVMGGSPQGTKLGNFLFIVTIDKIERTNIRAPAPEEIVDHQRDTEQDTDVCGLRQLAGWISAIRRFDSGVAVASTPRKLSLIHI